MDKIFPVILSGGSGSRLWPLSRESLPKQFLRLTGGETMLQQAVSRVADSERYHPVTVVANVEHRFIIAEQLRQIGASASSILLEPFGRNTAPAIAAAALCALETDPQAVILVMPADHQIRDLDCFSATVEAGLSAASTGHPVLFGIPPTAAVTGYGYVHAEAGPDLAPKKVLEFVEKPDLARAETFVQGGQHYWNSGIFLLPAAGVVADLTTWQPELVEAVQSALKQAQRDMDFVRLEESAFARSPSISIDYALMEKTDRAVLVTARFPWSDVGAWSALLHLADADAEGNVSMGDTVSLGTRNSYLRSEGPLLAALGVEDLVVIATPDAVLVSHRKAEQEVKGLVDKLRRGGHPAATQTPRVYRPWGWYESVHGGDRFQVKRITVEPGARLSLQRHLHRAEHWVVVSGVAEVWIDDQRQLLRENESVFIPSGAVHRLANPGRLPLSVIEVQTGAYLGEDDITRFEDDYARA